MTPELLPLWKLALIFAAGVVSFILVGQGVLTAVSRLRFAGPQKDRPFFGISETFLTGSFFTLLFPYLLYQSGRQLGIEPLFKVTTIAGSLVVLSFAIGGLVSIFPKIKSLPGQLKPLIVIAISAGYFALPMILYPGLQFTAFEGTDVFGYTGTAKAMTENWYHLLPANNQGQVGPAFRGDGGDPVTDDLAQSAAYRPSRAWTYRMMFSGERPLSFYSVALISTLSGTHLYQGYWLTGAWILGLYGAAMELLWRLWKKEPLSWTALLMLGLFSVTLSGMLGNLDRQYLGHTWANLVLIAFPLGIFAFSFRGKKDLVIVSLLLFIFCVALWAIYDTRYALFGVAAFLATIFCHAPEGRIRLMVPMVLVSIACFILGSFFLEKNQELMGVAQSPAAFGAEILPPKDFFNLFANDLHVAKKGALAPVVELAALAAGGFALFYAFFSFWKKTGQELPARMHTYLAILLFMFFLTGAKFLWDGYFPGCYKSVFGAYAVLVPLLVCSFARPGNPGLSARKIAFGGIFILLGVSAISGTSTFSQRITRQVPINVIHDDLPKLARELDRLDAQGIYLDVNENPAQLLLVLNFLPENRYGFGVPYRMWLHSPGLFTKETEALYKAANARILAGTPERLYRVRRSAADAAVPSWEIQPISIAEWKQRMEASEDDYKKNPPQKH